MEISDFPGIKLVLLAGKGGVGRTTCSATLAFHFADSGRSFGQGYTEGIAAGKDFPEG
jgi:anion-transporting  ArsA/GET3 family ATPase